MFSVASVGKNRIGEDTDDLWYLCCSNSICSNVFDMPLFGLYFWRYEKFFSCSLGAAVAFFLLFAPTGVLSDNADDYFKYSAPKTESYAIAGNSTGSYFNVSNKKTSVIVLGKDGTSHIKSSD